MASVVRGALHGGFDAEDYGRVVSRFEKAETLKQEVAKKKVRTDANRLPRHQPRFEPSLHEWQRVARGNL